MLKLTLSIFLGLLVLSEVSFQANVDDISSCNLEEGEVNSVCSTSCQDDVNAKCQSSPPGQRQFNLCTCSNGKSPPSGCEKGSFEAITYCHPACRGLDADYKAYSCFYDAKVYCGCFKE